MHARSQLLVIAFAAALVVSASAASVCDELFARLPNVERARCEEAKLQAHAARSVQGRPLYTGDVVREGARARVLVVGAMHGDELSSASVALHWIALARAAHGSAAQTHWRFIPALNPDGLFSRPARRVNAHGVDLNRNFPTPNWEREADRYWQQRTRRDPRRWPGVAPLSEPESKFLFEEMRRFKPHVVVSIHAPYGVLDFDGPLLPPSRLGRLHLDQVGVFPGSLGNYGGLSQGVPVVTIELPHALKTPSDAEMRRMWQDLQRWMDATITPSLDALALRQASR